MESDDTKLTTVRIYKKYHKELKKMAAEYEVTITDILNIILEKVLGDKKILTEVTEKIKETVSK